MNSECHQILELPRWGDMRDVTYPLFSRVPHRLAWSCNQYQTSASPAWEIWDALKTGQSTMYFCTPPPMQSGSAGRLSSVSRSNPTRLSGRRSIYSPVSCRHSTVACPLLSHMVNGFAIDFSHESHKLSTCQGYPFTAIALILHL